MDVIAIGQLAVLSPFQPHLQQPRGQTFALGMSLVTSGISTYAMMKNRSGVQHLEGESMHVLICGAAILVPSDRHALFTSLQDATDKVRLGTDE